MSRGAKIALGVLVVVIGGVTFVSMSRGSSNRATEVREEKVGRRDLVAAVTASGKIDAKSRTDVSSEVTARITALHVKEGDMVTKGMLLVELDQVQFKGAVDRAAASLISIEANQTQARTNRDQAKRTLDRSLALKQANAGGISDEAIDNLRQIFDVAEAGLAAANSAVVQAKAGLKEAQDNLGRTRITAPISGRVVRLAVQEGEVAVPGTFSRETGLLMRIADLSVILAKVKVDETDVVRLALNDSVSVTIDAFPDTTFMGRVTKIANSAAVAAATGQSSDRAVDFEVEVTLTNPPKDVRPDLSMTARIITDVRKNSLSIPIIALTARADSSMKSDSMPGAQLGKQTGDSSANKKKKEREGVFVINNGVAIFRPVKVGIAGDEHFEVLDGLKEGETIVAGSYQAIRDMKDSAKVKAASTGPEVKKP